MHFKYIYIYIYFKNYKNIFFIILIFPSLFINILNSKLFFLPDDLIFIIIIVILFKHKFLSKI